MARNDIKINKLVDIIINDYEKGRDIDQIKRFGYPDQSIIVRILEKIKYVIYPGYYHDKINQKSNISYDTIAALLKEVNNSLKEQIAIV